MKKQKLAHYMPPDTERFFQLAETTHVIRNRLCLKTHKKMNPAVYSISRLMRIPDSDACYACCLFRYKSQVTRFHIIATMYFAKESLAVKPYLCPDGEVDNDELTPLQLYLYSFFDLKYLLDNKKKFFRHTEYVTDFTFSYDKEGFNNLKTISKFLKIPKGSLKKNRNYVSLWDSFPWLCRVISPCRWSFRRTRRAKLDFLENFLDAVIKDREENRDPELFKNWETRTIGIID